MKNLFFLAFLTYFAIGCVSPSDNTDIDETETWNDEVEENIGEIESIDLNATQSYTFATSPIYTSPNANSETIGTVKAGEKIDVVSKSDLKYEKDGYDTNWLEINTGATKGYVWGGNISNFVMEADFDTDGTEEMFLLSNKTVDPTIEGSDNNRYEIKMIRDGQVVAEKNQAGYFGYKFKKATLKTLPGFTPELTVLELEYDFEGESSGYGMEYLHYKNGELTSIFKENILQSADGYDCSTTLYMPTDVDGIENVIIVSQKCGETDCVKTEEEAETSGKPVCEYEYLQFRYTWDGTNLSRK